MLKIMGKLYLLMFVLCCKPRLILAVLLLCLWEYSNHVFLKHFQLKDSRVANNNHKWSSYHRSESLPFVFVRPGGPKSSVQEIALTVASQELHSNNAILLRGVRDILRGRRPNAVQLRGPLDPASLLFHQHVRVHNAIPALPHRNLPSTSESGVSELIRVSLWVNEWRLWVNDFVE